MGFRGRFFIIIIIIAIFIAAAVGRLTEHAHKRFIEVRIWVSCVYHVLAFPHCKDGAAREELKPNE